jgi:hypothetical protein
MWGRLRGLFGSADQMGVSRKMKKIILLEFKRTADCSETYSRDMRRVAE